MSKIVQAANAMIVNSHLVTHVMPMGSRYIFVYNNKYKWSISTWQEAGVDTYQLIFFPGKIDLEDASTLKSSSPPYVAYSTKEFSSKEALDSFSELYMIIQEKLYGVDKALEDIIKDVKI